MPRVKTIIDYTLTGLLVLCALTVTGLAVNREVKARPKSPIREQRDWKSYAKEGHRIGSPNGKAVIVEFADFQCPACGLFETQVAELRRRHPGDVTVVYRHFPLVAIHPFAEPAALASECAALQGRFESMHDSLFAHRDSLARSDWTQVAASAGVNDLSAFKDCMSDRATAQRVASDVAAGNRLGISSTPTLLIDGKLITGVPPTDTLDAMITHMLAARR